MIQFVYGLQGELLTERDQSGTVLAEYLYLNGRLLAMLQSGQVYYVHTDHLGTPSKLTNSTGTVVWSATYDPFGASTVNEDPDGDSQTITLNVRFPGQYYDSETELHYNYFRYYDPATGRYITSDPIGLLGGINTYVYVENDPLNWIDPLGLARICSRPLDGFGGFMAGPLRHDQILYDDGTNSGFFNDDAIRSDIGHNRSEYSCSAQNYEDNAVRSAEEQVQRIWDMDWRLIGNNCQNYTNAVIDQLTGQSRQYRKTRRGKRIVR